MLSLNLENAGVVLGLTGVSLLSASSTSLVLRSTCPLLGVNRLLNNEVTENTTNTTTNSQLSTRECPVSLLTRSGLVLGLVSLGTGSALRVVSLFQ